MSRAALPEVSFHHFFSAFFLRIVFGVKNKNDSVAKEKNYIFFGMFNVVLYKKRKKKTIMEKGRKLF